MRLEAVILPDLGTDPDEPIVISSWFAGPGDVVYEGDRLVEVLIGPATFDVHAPTSGRLAEISCHEDDRISPGAILGLVAVSDGLDDPDDSSFEARDAQDPPGGGRHAP